MFKVKYNSQELEYKKPFGAVKINENIEFNIKANALCNVKMMIKSEKGLEELNLEKTGKNDEYYIYSLKLNSSMYLGPIFYYFIFEKDDEIFFYTNKEDLLGGEGQLYKTNPEIYYHTYIYDLKYKVPEWFKTGIVYHVFVDRFNNDDCSLEFIDRDLVEVYGGTLRGIINKLDYLEELGVSIILLSPIFESKSHHKYDTGDYKKISGDYGDLDTFKELIEKLKQKDMHIILDGVFNHSGSDSKYFNRYNNYDSLGAYQSRDSKYYEWYSFNDYPDDYLCWGDIDTLPQHNQSNEDFLDYILFNENSVVRYWMNLGIDGWRLDACDQLSDKFLSQIYDVVKENNPESVIIAELWNDATNFKYHSENEIHKYLCGNEVESVIDYPLHGLILEYCKGNHSPEKFERGYYSLIENYPKEYFYSLLNILGTHDVERVLTLLENNIEWVKMAIVLLFTLPGVPLIYYGDEAGLNGGKDPDNRKPLPWDNINEEIYGQYKNLCKIRNEHEALKKGSVDFIENEDFLIYKRTFNDENIYVVLNNSSDKQLNMSVLSNNAIKLKDIESNTTYYEDESIAIGDYKIFVEK